MTLTGVHSTGKNKHAKIKPLNKNLSVRHHTWNCHEVVDLISTTFVILLGTAVYELQKPSLYGAHCRSWYYFLRLCTKYVRIYLSPSMYITNMVKELNVQKSNFCYSGVFWILLSTDMSVLLSLLITHSVVDTRTSSSSSLTRSRQGP